jgi:hypothetical protein
MQKVHRHFFMKLRLLVSVLVHIFSLPYNRVLFTFPSQYLYTIGLETIFRLRRWFSQFSNTKAFYLHALFSRSNTGLSPSLVEYSNSFYSERTVQPFPLSFANTYGISVDFFSLS